MHHAYIDKFAYQSSIIHSLDSRVKFVVTVIFSAFVIAQPQTSVAILFCYAVFPFALLAFAQIPIRYIFKHIILVSPFIIVLALTSPYYDRTPVNVVFGPFSWNTTGGWLRCFSISVKFTVTMLALLSLISTTKFYQLLKGLQNLGVPKMLVLQLGFLYRYIFVLIDTAHHLIQAKKSRTTNYPGIKAELKTSSAMIGSLFIRSLDNAEQINIAMQARGFNGKLKTLSDLKITIIDWLFIAVSIMFLAGVKFIIEPAMK
jgi:cobalt/nickel transport system permease protein